MHLREANLEDALDCLQWKNDIQTRQNSIVSDQIIIWSDHLHWMRQRLKKPGFFIICKDDKKVGWIRFDIEDEIEVAIVIAEEYRGQGIASKVVGIASSLVQSFYKKPLMAKIVDGNTASWRVFVDAGFRVSERKEHNGKKYTVLRRGC